MEVGLAVGYCPNLSPLLSWGKKNLLGHKSNGLHDMESLGSEGREMKNEIGRLTIVLTYFCVPMRWLPKNLPTGMPFASEFCLDAS